MFLRFYQTNDQIIDKCLEELKPLCAGLVRAERYPMTKTVNLLAPTGYSNVEVMLYFDTDENKNAFYQNAPAMAIYEKYACPGTEGKIIMRKPGDSCLGV